MRDVIYVKLDIVYLINQLLNETISRKSYFFETVKSKVIISLFETVRLSVSISPRNLYNPLKSIKENTIQPVCMHSTTLTHAALKSSGHKGRHHFKPHFFHIRHRTKTSNPFLHRILSLLTEQDGFDIVLANPGCHARF